MAPVGLVVVSHSRALARAAVAVGVAAALIGHARLAAPGPLERDTAVVIPKGGIDEIQD